MSLHSPRWNIFLYTCAKVANVYRRYFFEWEIEMEISRQCYLHRIDTFHLWIIEIIYVLFAIPLTYYLIYSFFLFAYTQICQKSNKPHLIRIAFYGYYFFHIFARTYARFNLRAEIRYYEYNRIICLLISFIAASGGGEWRDSDRCGHQLRSFRFLLALFISFIFFVYLFFAGKNLGDSQPNVAAAASELFECGWLILQQCRVR